MKAKTIFFLAVLLLMAHGAWAQDATMIDGVYYLLNIEDKTAEVVEPSGFRYEGDIVVPDYVKQDGTDYAVTTLGEGAFMQSKLTSLQLPKKTLRVIGDLAFLECSGLTEIDIPEGVTTIGQSAFDGYDFIRISIPASVTEMGSTAVGACPELESVTVAEGNTHFGVFDGVLMDKAQTRLICYPAKMAGTAYTVPATVTSFDHRAFQYLAFLTSLTIPASVATLDNNMFYKAYSLAEINIAPAHTAYRSVDGVLYSTDMDSLCLYPAGKLDKAYTVNAATKIIGQNAFTHNSHLEAVTIPEGVATIYDAAFYYCTALKNIDFPESLTSIGHTAFANCESLETIVLPPNITEIPMTLLSFCKSLRSVTIPAGVTSIGMTPFILCTSLKEITCLATTPPTLHAMAFTSMMLGDITLYVPEEAVDTYKATPKWKDFNVQAIAPTVEPSLTLTEITKMGSCTVYSFNYPSVSATGKPTVLSSALFAWTPENIQETDSIESLHIFSHITIASDDERPTTTATGVSEEQGLLQFLPGRTYTNYMPDGQADYVGHCIIIAPDYEGYGVTKNTPHPYLSQRLTAQQIIDGVKYGLELYKKEAAESITLLPMKSDWRSFCMGFSQGGAVSLATHREIEEQGLADELHFQGSLCGDGPYDLIATLRYYIEDDGTSYGVETEHRKGKVTLPVVVPLILKGMFETHPDMKAYKIEDFLSQQLIDTGILDWIDCKAYKTAEIGEKWYAQLQTGVDTLGRHYSPEQMADLFESPGVNMVWGKIDKMFSPAVYEYMMDASNFEAVPEVPANAGQALHRALADNSLITGWEPQHRIQFFHSKHDVIVPYGNLLNFRDAHPQGEGNMYRIDDSFSANDHLDAGASFLMTLLAVKSYGAYFNWICEGNTTGIVEMDDVRYLKSDAWYTLDGRCLNGKPSQKGFYIHNGKKTVIK